jgi:Tfp pilus assembly pilus retraction ATPase PilT
VRMVKEVLRNNWAVANLIRENDIFQIPSIMQMGAREWMQLLESDIIKLVFSWIISEEEWMKYANNPKLIREWLAEA